MTDNQKPLKTIEQRHIRVFVSSTFQDLFEEREELTKRVFSALRRMCERRGVTWGEVDLRWGITEEQKAEGKVLPICLEEIKRCRPYFIGILGERYGWIPHEIPQELVDLEPWLAEHLQSSVTELEIIHGVLRNPEMKYHAFFYFRDPQYISTLPKNRQAVFREIPTAEEINRFGKKEAEFRAEERRKKLEALKTKIRLSGHPVHENYANPRALGDLVLLDFQELIDTLFPEGSLPDPLDRDAADHEAFARSRSRVYIGREDYFRRLDEHALGDGLPLVVLGESGSGKSALLANWAGSHQSSHPDDFILIHFIGASPHSADWTAMLRRIMGELKRRFSLPQDIPGKSDELRSAFANWLHMTPSEKRIILVLDALNQLEDRDGAPDLVWLPSVLPAHVRLLLSTLPGRPLNELKRRNCPILTVEPLRIEERDRFIEQYLAQYTKVLSPLCARLIARAEPTFNPLYLQALLEELRLFGIHEKLEERISYYLEAKTIPALFEKILSRYEQDYEKERPSLVREAMSFLWAARRGLSEAEILDLLGSEEGPLPQAYWSPFFLASEHSLVIRSGLIAFFHDYMKQAVKIKYLLNVENETAAHQRLAGYFDSMDLSDRQVDELPYQLKQAGEWDRLRARLTEEEFFNRAWRSNEFDVKAYWTHLEKHSHRLTDAYRQVLDAPDKIRNLYFTRYVASLLYDKGHGDHAFAIWKFLSDSCDRGKNQNDLQFYLNNQAIILESQGKYQEAMDLYVQVESICRKQGYRNGLAYALNNQAVILIEWGKLESAMEIFKRVEQEFRELKNKDGHQLSLFNQAWILKTWGRLDEAMGLLEEAKRLNRELGQLNRIVWCIHRQSMILRTWGRLDEAMSLLREAESICRELGEPAMLEWGLNMQANILFDQADYQKAMSFYKECEQICREINSINDLAFCLNNQAFILKIWGDLSGAMRLYKESEALFRDMGSRSGLLLSLRNQAWILMGWGRLDEAAKQFQEAGQISRELNSQDDLQSVLGGQGKILVLQGRWQEAMQLFKEAEKISRQISNKNAIQWNLNERASILLKNGNYQQAIVLYKDVETICRELGNKEGLAFALNNQAVVFIDQGRNLPSAMKLLDEAQQIFQELNHKDGLRLTIGNQGVIQRMENRPEKALALHQKEERICRELDDKGAIASCLANQARALSRMYRRAEAFAKADEALRLAREHGFTALANQIQSLRNSFGG